MTIEINTINRRWRRKLGEFQISDFKIVSAIEGEYGNHHRITRTFDSELWINPLMSMYWSFDLKAVMKKNLYYALIKNTNSLGELNSILFDFRRDLKIRKKKQLPI